MGPTARSRTRRRAIVILVVAAGLCCAVTVAILGGGGREPATQGSQAGREADAAYITGLGAYHQRDWARAISNFEAALSRDPSHVDAREHLDLALAEDRHQQTLARARAALEAGRADEAAALATTIPQTSVYATEARELRRLAGVPAGPGGAP